MAVRKMVNYVIVMLKDIHMGVFGDEKNTAVYRTVPVHSGRLLH